MDIASWVADKMENGEDATVNTPDMVKNILDTAEIMNIVTKKSFRNMGTGKQMLEYLINMCKNSNIKTLNLEVNSTNTIAITLYKKNNFKEVGLRKKYYDNTYDAIIMSLNF